MPIILMPFRDVRIYFSNVFYDIAKTVNISNNFINYLSGFNLNEESNISLEYVQSKLINYYNNNNIDLNNHKSLNQLNYIFDDSQNLHLK